MLPNIGVIRNFLASVDAPIGASFLKKHHADTNP
jgi:hypothetical protein